MFGFLTCDGRYSLFSTTFIEQFSNQLIEETIDATPNNSITTEVMWVHMHAYAVKVK